jgi:hypothetical protein
MWQCTADFSFGTDSQANLFTAHIKEHPIASGLISVGNSHAENKSGHIVSTTIIECHKAYIENISAAYGGCRISGWISNTGKTTVGG